jgi:ankyrin repeat protein
MPDLNQFHEHVKRGDLAEVRSALAEDPSLLEANNASGQSAFLLAKYYHQDAIADYLLSLNPTLDVFNACVAGRTGAVLADIDRDPSLLKSHGSDGWTPLHLAAFFGHIDLAASLIDRGADVNARSTNGLNNAPLHAAAAGGHTDLVTLLLERGADVNARQEGGWTALHAAAQAGNRRMAEILLASGGDAAVRAANNQLPLDLALSRGHADVAALLERPMPGATAQ